MKKVLKREQSTGREQAHQDCIYRHNKGLKFNVEARTRELKVLMHRNHPDKGGDLDLPDYP